MKLKPIIKNIPAQVIREAIMIFCIASLVGLVVNIFHPESVHITSQRPSLKFTPDTVLAQDLPEVSVRIDSSQKTTGSEDDVVEPLLITTSQVLQLKTSGQLLLFDARSSQEFAKAHIPKAENIPYKNLTDYITKLDSLPRDKWLVCYCDGPSCGQAEQLAHALIHAGYELVAVYFDGLDGWKKSGYDIVGEEVGKSVR